MSNRDTLNISSIRPFYFLLIILSTGNMSLVHAETSQELEIRVQKLQEKLAKQQKELEKSRGELEKARMELEVSREETSLANTELETLKSEFDERSPADEDTGFKLGPVNIGGAMRVNYVQGSYTQDDPQNGPNRGSNPGNIELDTFRINLSMDHNNILGAFEYRWYSDYPQSFPANYNFIHTAWLGYRFDDENHIEVGINRVPFGAGAYGVAQSYMFDMHYYLGLADDMDLGVKYVTQMNNWTLDLAYYARSESSYSGRSLDSTRYSFDAVRWYESVDNSGNVIYGGEENGFDERNQLNFRGIYSFDDWSVPSELGFSLQYGQLRGKNVDDGDHWAASLHMINNYNNFKLGTQLTRYEYNIDNDNPWGTDQLLPMGAFDFAWFAASKAWVSAISLSYTHETPHIAWLDKIVPYIEYSQVFKDESDFNDSKMFSTGAQWYHNNWLIYTDLVYANGNWFIGNEDEYGDPDDYSRVFGVGDWGANGNDYWNYRFTINFGYYF